jgi:hypothetical protein
MLKLVVVIPGKQSPHPDRELKARISSLDSGAGLLDHPGMTVGVLAIIHFMRLLDHPLSRMMVVGMRGFFLIGACAIEVEAYGE